jgi:NADH/NAD ratio-sensing transcriptional regulator Rex
MWISFGMSFGRRGLGYWVGRLYDFMQEVDANGDGDVGVDGEGCM